MWFRRDTLKRKNMGNGKLAGVGPGIRVFKIKEITCWYVGC